MKIISMKGLVEKAHGKLCQHDRNIVAYRKKDGAMYSARRCNDRDLEQKPYSDKELEVKSTFASKSKIAGAWSRANRVYKEGSRVIDLKACTEDYRKMRAAFDAQDKIVTFQAFVWAQVKDGVVVVPDVSVGSSASPVTGNGGGSSTPAPSGEGDF